MQTVSSIALLARTICEGSEWSGACFQAAEERLRAKPDGRSTHDENAVVHDAGHCRVEAGRLRWPWEDRLGFGCAEGFAPEPEHWKREVSEQQSTVASWLVRLFDISSLADGKLPWLCAWTPAFASSKMVRGLKQVETR